MLQPIARDRVYSIVGSCSPAARVTKGKEARWAEPNQINWDWLVRRDGVCTPGSSSLSRYDRKKREKDASVYGSSFGDGHVSCDGRRHRICAPADVGGTRQLLELSR